MNFSKAQPRNKDQTMRAEQGKCSPSPFPIDRHD